MDFAVKLQIIRKAKKMTQQELAAQLFVSRSAIAKWENGNGIPSADNIKELSRVLGEDVSGWLKDSGDFSISRSVLPAHCKVSKFNHYFDLQNGSKVIFNAYSGLQKSVIVEKQSAEKVIQCLQESNLERLTPDQLNFFYDHGIVVSNGDDEISKIRFLDNEIDNYPILNITIIVTRQCNFRCKYCYESFENSHLPKKVEDAIVQYIRKNTDKYTGVHLAWFGGEPLLCLESIRRISRQVHGICRTAKMAFTASISTNGFLLTPQTFEILLKECCVRRFQITLDGCKDTHDSARVLKNGKRGTFDTIVQNLMEIKKSPFKWFTVVIRTNFSKKSIHGMQSYLEWLSKTLGDDARFSLLTRTVSYLGGGEEVLKANDGVIADYQDRHHVFSRVAAFDGAISLQPHYEMLSCGGGACYAGLRNQIVIDTDGTVRKCTCNIDSEQNVVGKLMQNGTIDYDYRQYELWCSSRLANEKCQDCSFLPVCLGKNCPAEQVYGWEKGCPYEKLELASIVQKFVQTHELHICPMGE